MTDKIGLYFVGEAVADQRADPENPRKMIIALGGSMYFGSMGAGKAIKNSGLENARSFYVGSVSDDFFGGLIREDFKNADVSLEYARQTAFMNKIAIISEDGQGGNKYSFYSRNRNDGEKHLQLEELPSSFNENKRIFSFGSVSTTLSPTGQTLKEFAKLRRAEGSVILFDPNTRPSVIPDVDVYRAAVEDWIQYATIAKASEEDIEFTYPTMSLEDVAKRWLSLGVRAVFFTHGSKGCSVYTGNDHAFIESMKSSGIKHTVGAGDNFNAGIVIALATQNITLNDQLDGKDIAFWHDVAKTANMTSYRHLLRLNNISET